MPRRISRNAPAAAPAFVRHRPPRPAPLASFASIATVLSLSAASYAAWSTAAAAFSRRSRKPQLLCRSGGRRLSSPSPVGGASAASGGRKFLGDLPFFAHRDATGRHRMASSMSLSKRNAGNDVAIGARDNFALFLKSLPTSLSERTTNTHADDDAPAIRVILGNEAGDADSIVSALGLAYVESLKRGGDRETMAVPVVSVARADVSLRRDVVLLLDLAGIDAKGLLHVDDDVVTSRLLPPPSSSRSSPEVELTLVDHNRIRSSLSHLSDAVVEIVDHHEDEGSHRGVTADSGRRVIAYEDGRATVASACTLVAERLFAAIDDSTNKMTTIDRGLGLSLLGVILLDSVNMLPAAGKGTKRDEDAMQQLLEKTNWSSPGSVASSLLDATTMGRIFPKGLTDAPDRKALFEALSGAKNDPRFWASLSPTDCLRIDYKKFTVPEGGGGRRTIASSIGLSSVLLDMDSLLAKDGFREDLASFLSKSDVDLLGIMTVDFSDGVPRRGMLLTGSDAVVVASFAEYLLNHTDAAFLEIAERRECVVEDGGEGPGDDDNVAVRVFRQGNGKGSRKQVAPVLLAHASSKQSHSLL